ncbi:helix-turn-helix domain-containing protein [Paractinoplanes globisporus]|uniref:Helix-turn-helix domain-containing protein n=1 Tax=Paractinoplanes globisporus TaxID=113565 RepID=A0ABW6WAI5_9ACTN|nr:helix-turn-helix transcriptional regulator [Actinoplanes globisporus]
MAIRDFLVSRRARITPESAGLPADGLRRVAGLRREEVAALAGVSVEYYIRLERGKCQGISDAVLAAVARALRLDDVEREHLFDLVHAANETSHERPWPPPCVRPEVRRLLDAMTDIPAYVWDGCLEIVAANELGRALFAPLYEGETANQARYIFLDPAAADFFPDWRTLAHDAVALLRAEAGRRPGDERLAALVGDLTSGSPAFRRMWADYDVRRRRSGVKRFRHPIVGSLTLTFESLAIVADPDLRMTAGTAEPGSDSETALRLLGSWSASTRTEGKA